LAARRGEPGEDLEAHRDSVRLAELAGEAEALGQQFGRLRTLAELDRRRRQRTGGRADLTVVVTLARELERCRQPRHRLGNVAGGERHQADVLLRERLAAQVAE